MDRITRNDLQELIEHQTKPCISIYLPTHRFGTEAQQDPIRFKNLLQQAEERLIQSGLRAPDAQGLIEQSTQQLTLNEPFWQQQSDGLAIFIAPDLFRHFRLPHGFDEMVTVADQFHVKPLFHLQKDEGRFYILALSQNEIRLIEGTKFEIEAVDLENVPTSLAEALKWDDPERQLQQHTTGRGGQKGGSGRPDTMFHGHGVGTDDQKTNLLRYFQKVDKGLQEYLAGERVPLVLAGVDYLLPIYREASSYGNLAEQVIIGNPEELRDEELHSKAWDLLEPQFKKTRQDAVRHYQQLAGTETGKASTQVEEIVQAAYGGRVSQLFIREGAEIWGRYNRSTNQVKVHPTRSEGSDDLLNIAAIDTFHNGGDVFMVTEEDMTDSSPLAAIFRY